MNNLGSRLETAISILADIGGNETFADIGSDHAFLAIEVLKRGIAKRAIAADINSLPLEKGRENAEKCGIDIEFILSDGFDALEDKGIKSAAICGMGGELIAKMILRSETAHRCTLVLQPMSAQEDLRKALWDNGFCIHSEKFVIDGGKPYTVMSVSYDGKKREYDNIDLYLGKERNKSVGFAKYCEKIKAAAEKRRLGIIARGESTEETDSLINECHTQMTSF